MVTPKKLYPASVLWSLIGIGIPPGLHAAADVETKHVNEFDLPQSSYLSRETRSALKDHHALWAAAFNSNCGDVQGSAVHMAEVRKCQAEAFYQSEIYKQIRARYPVSIRADHLGGVGVEVFTATHGIAPDNAKRVLINLHGGGFLEGSRTVSHLESIPIAAVSGITVISVDYRQAPEAKFPAASEDVAAVYRALLASHAPDNIGIYGCSAGGLLAAETVATLENLHLPLPGAIGMFCMGATYTGQGDSAPIARAIEGAPADEFAKYFAYFEGANPGDPLAYPAVSDEVLRHFPPSLLISATRDHALSSVAYTHSRLSALGREAELHVFEGLGHGFFYDPALPESREVYEQVRRFFDRHLKR